VTGALLSARFPVVTPSGALHYCPGGGGATTYVVDGGYYENSGLLTAIELLDAVREHGEGAAALEPWIVLLDNHYRSLADVSPASRPHELLVPVKALRGSRLLSQSALEQAAAIATDVEGEGCPRFGIVAPRRGPGLSAPLGWVLSQTSTTRLDDALAGALPSGGPAAEDPCLVPLRRALSAP
jgi:hypothetical protein